jgi:hypothetical protein
MHQNCQGSNVADPPSREWGESMRANSCEPTWMFRLASQRLNPTGKEDEQDCSWRQAHFARGFFNHSTSHSAQARATTLDAKSLFSTFQQESRIVRRKLPLLAPPQIELLRDSRVHRHSRTHFPQPTPPTSVNRRLRPPTHSLTTTKQLDSACFQQGSLPSTKLSSLIHC